ncbi:DUF4190 domain-containing protein [Cellulomonas soli]|uniref:DUF4190 domain-containing protein n=1 Tax=Cellulomonas soli TaxID=931535 RepID=UPI003F84880B
MVTGLLGLGPVAVVLGLVGLHRTRTRGTRGRGFAITGVVLGVLGTLLAAAGIVAAVLLVRASSSLPSDVASPRDAHVQQLVTGNCLGTLPEPAADGTVDTVQVVPCGQQHAGEVISQFEFAPDAVWPGQQAADARVARSCVLSPEEIEANATVITWAPTQDGWARGDRTGLCIEVLDLAEDV